MASAWSKAWGKAWGAAWGGIVAAANASGWRQADQTKPWPRPAVRRALMAQAEGAGIAGGSAAAVVRYPVAWLLPASAIGVARAGGSTQTSCLRSSRAGGNGSSNGRASASVVTDDAVEILALILAIDRGACV